MNAPGEEIIVQLAAILKRIREVDTANLVGPDEILKNAQTRDLLSKQQERILRRADRLGLDAGALLGAASLRLSTEQAAHNGGIFRSIFGT